MSGYGDDDVRKIWYSCGSTYCTCYWYNTHDRPWADSQAKPCGVACVM